MGKKNDNYIKIETPFKRDMDGSKKLVIGDYRSEALEYLAPLNFQWTEKIDGTCICVRWTGHEFEIEGHNKNSQIAGDLIDYIKSKFTTNEAEELVEQNFGETIVEFYGEGYGAGIQKGGGYSDEKKFIMFDIYLPESDLWLTRDSVDDIANALDIESVPILLVGTLDDAIHYVQTVEKTTIGKGEASLEGVVGRPLVELKDRFGKRIIVKVKKCDFLLDN